MNDIFLGMPEKTVQDAIAKRYLVKMVVQTTSSCKKAGIYGAEKNDISKPITINWGDGTVEKIDGNVSQKVHNYENVGTFTAYISNVKAFAASANNSTWYTTTSQNSQTLKEVELCSTITSIGTNAFFSCSGLTSVTISDSVTSIGDYAFYSCSGLTSITIPDSVTSIGDRAFSECGNLTSIIVDPTNPTYSSSNNLLLSKDGTTLIYAPNGLVNVIIPDSIITISEYAFYGSNKLTNVTIGESVQNIMDGAFYNCHNLTNVTIPNSVTSISEGAFQNCISFISINIPNSIENIGNYAFYGCENLTLTFEGRTQADIDNMANRYWGLDSSQCIPG